MKHRNIKKLTLAAVLVAVAAVGSSFSFPVGASKCCPAQHLVNVVGGVFLGPWYNVAMAFCAGLIRNLMGTGTLLAFPGSMCGALLCGLAYRFSGRLAAAYLGELFGTSVVGGLLAYPVAAWIVGSEAAVFGFVVPFLISSLGGTALAAVLVTALKKAKVLDLFLKKTGMDS